MLHKTITLILLLTIGCQSILPETVTPPQAELELTEPIITKTLPPPIAQTTPVPDPQDVVIEYLDYWKNGDLSEMYSLLTSVGKDAIGLDEFIDIYNGVSTEAALESIDYEIISSSVRSSRSASVEYRVTFTSVLVGDIYGTTSIHLTLEQGEWKIQWADNIIMQELGGGNYLWMDRHIPSRANIYASDGSAIVAYSDAVSIGLMPSQINPDEEESLLNSVQWLTGLHPRTTASLYEDFPEGVDWYLPLGEELESRVAQRYDINVGYSHNGLLMFPFSSRYYFENGISPHAIGYVSLIQEDEADDFLRRGYSIDEKVGRQGIEKWGEAYLGGVRGGTLYVIDPGGKVVTQLANVPATPSKSIYTTLNKELQLQAQIAMQKFRGAIVVMERETGRILAMVSSPWFDPNAFEPTNRNYSDQLAEIFDPYSGQPLLNRATRGLYPLGSVFKIITLAAGLESELYNADTTYDCRYTFNEIQGLPPRYDWTYDHFLEDDKTQPSGLLTLSEGLMRSCNPFFWHIGLDLYRRGYTNAVSDMALSFGLGEQSGLEVVEEERGQIPEPLSEVDAINLAIGQGDTLVTPLQVAHFISAIGNNGTFYKPQLIEKITSPDGEPEFTFEPQQQGQLAVSDDNLAFIQEAMKSVISNPRGTAYYALNSFSNSYNIPIAGKTGSAESGSGESHAWFAGYTYAQRENQPDITVVVIGENAGEGSEIAAPIFKAVVYLYFYGTPRITLPWESQPGLLITPEPEETDESTPW